MKYLIYKLIYSLPLRTIIGYMFILTIIWKDLGNYIQTKPNKKTLWKSVNILIFISTIAIIAIATLSSRTGSSTEVILTPFHSFVEAKIQPERYRSMLMNVFLFFPLGLSMPFALREKWKLKLLCTILFAMLLSVSIEYAQYHYQLGRTEIDDVLCNTFGCVIGSIAYLLVNKKKNER